MSPTERTVPSTHNSDAIGFIAVSSSSSASLYWGKGGLPVGKPGGGKRYKDKRESPFTTCFSISSRPASWLRSWAVRFSLVLLMFHGSFTYSQTNKSISNLGTPNSGNESGSFRIVFGGEQIGEEKFQITEGPSGFKATAEVRLTIDREKEKVVFLLKPVLTLSKSFEPSAYQVTQDDGVLKRTVRVVFKPDKSERIYEAGNEHDSREIALKKDVLILDDNAFHHYIFLTRRFDYVKGGVQEFSAFVPQQFLAGGISISDKGKAAIKIGEKDIVLQHLLVDTGELQISLWLDERHELKKLSVPKSNVEVFRE